VKTKGRIQAREINQANLVGALGRVLYDLFLFFPVFAPMIERILLVQRKDQAGRCFVSVRVLLVDDSEAVVRELCSLLSLNPGWLVCVGRG
jgi:hypothetical protein